MGIGALRYAFSVVCECIVELPATVRSQRRVAVVFCASALLYLLEPQAAWAVQAHGGSEGLVSHQIGHILFSVGMGYLLFKLYRMHQAGPGWGTFKAFLWLLILWNITTFSGHWMNEFVAQEKFLRVDGHTVTFTIRSFFDLLYYLTRLDHLLLVPSFVCLLLALKKWSQHA